MLGDRREWDMATPTKRKKFPFRTADEAADEAPYVDGNSFFDVSVIVSGALRLSIH